MLFVATLEHSPDNCWARKEAVAKEWIGGLEERAEEYDVEVHGAYATPNEHRFYFVMEAGSFEAVTGFLGSPFLEDHDGTIAPVLPISETPEVVLED